MKSPAKKSSVASKSPAAKKTVAAKKSPAAKKPAKSSQKLPKAKPSHLPELLRTGVDLLIGAVELYNVIKPLLDAIKDGLGLGFMAAHQTAKPTTSAVDLERQAIALGIVAQVLRELRTVRLPSAEYGAKEMTDHVRSAVQHMIETEQYKPLLEQIEIVALKQKLESMLRREQSEPREPPKI